MPRTVKLNNPRRGNTTTHAPEAKTQAARNAASSSAGAFAGRFRGGEERRGAPEVTQKPRSAKVDPIFIHFSLFIGGQKAPPKVV